jgi:vitamin B12 transporter
MSRFAFRSSASVLALSCALTPAFADDKPAEVEKVIVTASRIGAVPEDRLGTAVSVVTREQMDQRQTRFVSDVLRDVPSIAVSRSGGAGTSTQVRMRGSEANHTLVLFDGADISDPFQGEFDFAGLQAGDIERIEILRGSQSALYGSDAVGGVINLLPRRGDGALSVEAFAEAGSFETWATAANLGYGDDTADVFVSAGHNETSGTNVSRFGNEDDGEEDSSLFFNGGLRPASNLELRAFVRYVETKADTDPQDFAFPSTTTEGLVIDGPDTTSSKQLFANVSGELSLFDDMWQTRLSYTYADVDRENFSTDFFAFPVALTPFFTAGTRDKVSLVSGLTVVTGEATHKLTGAVDWKTERFQNVAVGVFDPGINGEREMENTGYVASYDIRVGDFDAGAAYRHDANDFFADADTYRIQASYRLTEATRVRASAGAGVKNPTNFELFGVDPGSFIGNPNLKPEKSVGWDVGLDHTFLDGDARFTATYFEATLEDEIFTVFTFVPPFSFFSSPDNRTTESERKGIELTLNAKLDEAWSLDAVYTYLDAVEAGLEEVRRPPHTAALNVSYRFLDRAEATLTVRYTGDQFDNEFATATPESRVRLQAFTLVNLSASYEVTDNIELFARAENLLDEKYEEVYSYATPGIAAYAGLRARF